MARKVKNAKLDTRSARLSGCPHRREPYWQTISKGCSIGYRRGSKGGTWIGRLRDDLGKQHYEALGAADDSRDGDGLTVYSYAQAQERARAWFASKARELAGHSEPQIGPYTVATAIEDYLAARERRGSKGVKKDRYAASSRIAPSLGAIEASKLTTKRIRDWLESLASAPKFIRTGRLAKKQATSDFNAEDENEVRARRSTANRLLTVLKASLNYAFQEGKVMADEPWRKVKPFREADSALIRYLSADECKRLVNACPADLRAIVQGALVTGCRYGELTRMVAADFKAEAGTVTVRLSKAGRVRHVVLAEEGRTHFTSLAAGRAPRDPIFLRSDRKVWAASHQQRPLFGASRVAKIDPPATFHVLRHTYASSLAMKGVQIGVIAAQLGHSDTRMTEKHYAHLSPNYVADTIRAALPALANVERSNVHALGRS
jgi:integrase